MITINLGAYRTLQRKKPFGKRPYSFIFIKRSDYHFLDDFVATFEKLGFISSVVTIYPTTSKQDFIQNVVSSAASINPDFVFTFSHSGVDQDGDIIHLLEDLNIPLVSWILDNPELILRPYKDLQSDNVYIFSTDKTAVPGISRIGYNNVFYLPLAANVDAQSPVCRTGGGAVRSDSISLLFIGDTFVSKLGQYIKSTKSIKALLGTYKILAKSLVANHEALLERLGSPEKGLPSIESLFQQEALSCESRHLASLSPEARQRFELIVYLYANTIYRSNILKEAIHYDHLIVGPPTWKRLLNNPNINLLPSTYDKKIVNLLYRNASINLNVTSMHMNGAANQRIFDVPTAGGFLLTDYSNQLEGLFDLDKEIVYYVNRDDFQAKVDKYLFDKKAREKVVIAANHRIAAEHRYVHRAAAILNTLKASCR